MENTKNPLKRFPPDSLQVLAHYYRAEVYRSSVWRTRLDVTTNWAILAMTAAFSWSFTSEPQTHIIFPITSLVVLLLLFIETRRYRYYDLWWTRARLLEGHLIVPALNPELNLNQGDWREFLSNDLLLPSFKISFWEAFTRRLVNIYMYVFLLLLFGWILRVFAGADRNNDGFVTLNEFLVGCGYGHFYIARYVILCFEIVFTLSILLILFFNWQGRHVTGEIRRKNPQAPSWPI